MYTSLRKAFVSDDKQKYAFKLGQVVASALSGFVVGVITATVIWMLALYYINNLLLENGAENTPSPQQILRDASPF
ncbi:MAG: hypothetical protein AAB417_01595 [Patescibacteria group bacterium]